MCFQRSYRKLAVSVEQAVAAQVLTIQQLATHPDKCPPERQEEATRMFADLQQAYEVSHTSCAHADGDRY